MTSRRRTPSAAARRALLTGAALAVLWPAGVHAQALLKDGKVERGEALNPTGSVDKPRVATPTATDGLQEGELYMEADRLVRDENTHITTAEGSVEIRYENRTLRADKVVYEEGQTRGDGQGVIRAFGHVQIVNDDGTVEYGDQYTLDDKMAAGVALGFSARLQQNEKLASASAVRKNDTIQELTKAIFTPCPICAANGKPVTPTWSISAERVVQDKKHRVIIYRNAHVHVLGATVLYMPVFWHADPSADRASGFLTPRMGVSDRRGFTYQQPYLFVLSPSSDLVLSPQLNTKVNPFLNGEYRQRFENGDIDIRFGYTHDRDFDSNGSKFGNDTNRSYILGRGDFQLDEFWRAGFTAERVSDDLIFDKYEVGKVYEARGPYVADDRRLISQLFATRQDDNSYFSAAAFSIQGLRPGDNDRTFPLVAPLIEEHFDPNSMVFGGRIRFNASAVVLTRDEDPTNAATVDLPGTDSRRVTAGADWRRSFIFASGLRIDPFVDVRADGYSLSDVLTGVGATTKSETLGRALGVAGADISYPVYRRIDNGTLVLEPLAQVAVSPDARQVITGHDATGKPIYLNEDSVAFEFDETTLFEANKFPGYDLYEDGARVNLGGRASMLWDDGRRASLLIGRSFRSKDNDVFSASSGLRQEASDWVVATDAQPMPGVQLFARADLDGDSLNVHRAEAGVNFSNKWGSAYARYLTDDLDINGVKDRNLDLGGTLNLTKNWGVSFAGNRDLLQNAWVIRDIGLFYKDDCTRVDVIYRREDTVIGRLGPSQSISVRLTLATLGGAPNAR